MRFALPILSLALICAATPADAQTTRQRLSAASSAGLNQLHRLHQRLKNGEIDFSLGLSYKRFDAGGESGTTPMALSYQGKDSSVIWFAETDGYAWEKPQQLAFQSGLSESRLGADYEFGSDAAALTLGYAFGVTPKGDNENRSYTHTIHAAISTTLGSFSPGIDLTRSWANGDTPGIWSRTTEVYLGADYKPRQNHTLSAGLTRQIVDGIDSISSVEASYEFPITRGNDNPVTLALTLRLGLGEDEEYKKAQLVFARTF